MVWQVVATQAVGAMCVHVIDDVRGVVGARLDGFKSRALRDGATDAQACPLYTTEWRQLAVVDGQTHKRSPELFLLVGACGAQASRVMSNDAGWAASIVSGLAPCAAEIGQRSSRWPSVVVLMTNTERDGRDRRGATLLEMALCAVSGVASAAGAPQRPG